MTHIAHTPALADALDMACEASAVDVLAEMSGLTHEDDWLAVHAFYVDIVRDGRGDGVEIAEAVAADLEATPRDTYEYLARTMQAALDAAEALYA